MDHFLKGFIELVTILLPLFMFYFFGRDACGILVPWPRIEPAHTPLTSSAPTSQALVGGQGPNHWTAREVPINLVQSFISAVWYFLFLVKRDNSCFWLSEKQMISFVAGFRSIYDTVIENKIEAKGKIQGVSNTDSSVSKCFISQPCPPLPCTSINHLACPAFCQALLSFTPVAPRC